MKRTEAAAYGLAPGDVARLLETAYRGRRVSVVIDEDRWFDLVVWYDESARSDPRAIDATILDTLAEVQFQRGHPERALVIIDEAIAREPQEVYYREQRRRFFGERGRDDRPDPPTPSLPWDEPPARDVPVPRDDGVTV